MRGAAPPTRRARSAESDACCTEEEGSRLSNSNMFIAISAATLCLAGCEQRAEEIAPRRDSKSVIATPQASSPAPAPAAPLSPTPAPLPAASVLTSDGIGQLRLGMSRAEAAATGLLLAAEEDASEECEIYQLKEDPDSWAMFLGNKLTRISLEGKSRTRTQAGLGLGSKEAEVLATYGSAVEVEPHAYDGPDAHYLTIWTRPKTRGIRFETNAEGIVEVVHGGGQTIQFVEGCS